MNDREAFDVELAAFVRARYPSLVRTAYLLCGDRVLAEDLTQGALARACERGMRGVRIEDLGGYVYRAMVNAHISAGRRRWRAEIPSTNLPEHPDLVGPTRIEDRDQLARLLLQLPVKQRAALVLRYYGDLSEAETASALGCPTGTAKTLTARGLARLRELADPAAAPNTGVS